MAFSNNIHYIPIAVFVCAVLIIAIIAIKNYSSKDTSIITTYNTRPAPPEPKQLIVTQQPTTVVYRQEPSTTTVLIQHPPQHQVFQNAPPQGVVSFQQNVPQQSYLSSTSSTCVVPTAPCGHQGGFIAQGEPVSQGGYPHFPKSHADCPRKAAQF